MSGMACWFEARTTDGEVKMEKSQATEQIYFTNPKYQTDPSPHLTFGERNTTKEISDSMYVCLGLRTPLGCLSLMRAETRRRNQRGEEQLDDQPPLAHTFPSPHPSFTHTFASLTHSHHTLAALMWGQA